MNIYDHGFSHALIDILQILHNLLGCYRIKGSHRLICQNDIGLLHQGPGNGNPLLLSSGKLVTAGMEFIQQSYSFQCIIGPLIIFL